MTHRFPMIVVVGTVLLRSSASAQSPADQFVAGLMERADIPADARSLLETTWADCDGCDPEEFLTQGLAVVSTRFREGLDAFDDADYARCHEIMRALSDHADPFVRWNARVYEIQSLAQADYAIEALDRLQAVRADGGAEALQRYTYAAAEMDFLYGFLLLADLDYAGSRKALERFLRSYPNASQRLVISAQQMLAELANRVPEQLGDVVDLMKFCGNRLDVSDSGRRVQDRQERVIELLDDLIKNAQQREKSSSGGGGGSSGGRAPSNPMQDSMLPGGGSGDAQPMRERRFANPAESWGSMPPAERERILQALRDSFPSRYRRLVEQYYEELAKKP